LSLQPESIRILIAEDNLVNQKLALLLLTKSGYTVDVASNGAEAVELFDRLRHPLIFMDAQMPEMDGYQATQAIRLMEKGPPRAVIVALTAHAMAGDRERCLEAGMDDYLPKPLQIATFYEGLERWLLLVEERSANPPQS
jgi:two-component system sensor histidine kinase/response regulator